MTTKWRTVAWAMLLCGVGVLSACGGDEGIPDVVGMDREEAVALLEEYELAVTVQEQPSTEKTGVVLSQTPAAGEEFPEDDKVTIAVASEPVSTEEVLAGDVPAPDVTGLKLSDAEQKLRERGVPLGTVTPQKSELPPLVVLAQRPAPGELVPASGVDLDVSESNTVPVPKLITLTEAEAVAEIEKQGFRVGSIETALQGQGAVGRVIEQSPDPGFEAPRGSPIRIVVKQPAAQVPPVLNQTLDAVASRLVQSGLIYDTHWVLDPKKPKGTIVRMDPGPNTLVARGSTVTLTVTRQRPFFVGTGDVKLNDPLITEALKLKQNPKFKHIPK